MNLFIFKLLFLYPSAIEMYYNIRKFYNVHMDLSAMPKAFFAQHCWHLATLYSVLAESKTLISIPTAAAAPSKLLYNLQPCYQWFWRSS